MVAGLLGGGLLVMEYGIYEDCEDEDCPFHVAPLINLSNGTQTKGDCCAVFLTLEDAELFVQRAHQEKRS